MAIARKWVRRGAEVAFVLRIVEVSRSTYYWRQHPDGPRVGRNGGRPIPGVSKTTTGQEVTDEGVKALLQSAIEGDGYCYGYRKSTHWLRREHKLIINEKKVYRLCREMRILRPQRKRTSPRYPRRAAANWVVTGVNQLWETDIKYGYIAGEKRFFFVQAILDVYDRMVVDYHIGLSCTGAEAARALQGAMTKRQLQPGECSLVVRTDNGPQFVSADFNNACAEFGIEHEYIPTKTPNKIAHIESFHSLLQEECLSRYEFETFTDAYLAVVAYIDYYNHRRIHGSLGYRTPSEYHEACRRKTARTSPIKL